MGTAKGCLRILKFPRAKSEVTTYDDPICKADETCECGKVFLYPEARFCCFCGRKREGMPPLTKGSQPAPPKFTEVCPSNNSPLPRRSNSRKGTGHSSSSTSSSGSHTYTQSSVDQSLMNEDTISVNSSRTNQTVQTAESTKTPQLAASEQPPSPTYSSGNSRTRRHSLPSDPSAGVSNGRRPSLPAERGTARRPSLPDSGIGGTPARRPSLDATPVASSVEDVVSALAQALKHSGSLCTQSLRMRALQVPESLARAYNAVPKADMLMPQFDAKVDLDNLLDKLPLSSMRGNLSLQRVTFMSTEWLGIRLSHSDHAQCTRFCLCATALQNIGKNTSRSVVVECSEDKLVFACSPMYEWRSSFIDHADEIGELAQLVFNEAGNSEKKVASDLKSWCQKTQTRTEQGGGLKKAASEGDITLSDLDSPAKTNLANQGAVKRRFSLQGFVATLEESFASLGSDSKKTNNAAAKAAVTVSRRRMSAPGGGSDPGFGRQSPRDSNSHSNSPERRSGGGESPRRSGSHTSESSTAGGHHNRPRRHSLGAGLTPAPPGPSHSGGGGSRSAGELPEHKKSGASGNSPRERARRRRNSDPGFGPSHEGDQSAPVISPKMKRRPSFSAHDIMPTLDEDTETSVGLKPYVSEHSATNSYHSGDTRHTK